jgi:hypothetical protein
MPIEGKKAPNILQHKFNCTAPKHRYTRPRSKAPCEYAGPLPAPAPLIDQKPTVADISQVRGVDIVKPVAVPSGTLADTQ